MRNALAHAGKSGRRVVSAFIAKAFAKDTPETASTQWRNVADQIRPKVPKLAQLMDTAEEDVLAYMTFPKQHWTKLHSMDEIDKCYFVTSPGTSLRMFFGSTAPLVFFRPDRPLYRRRARATSWRSVAHRLTAPPGSLIQALPD